MNSTMNPFNNRWALLFVVAAFLLLVSELVGTDQSGGVLSQVAAGRSAAEAPVVAGPPAEAIQPAAPEIVEEVPEEDLPEMITEDEAEDVGNFETIDVTLEEENQPDVADEPVEEEPVE